MIKILAFFSLLAFPLISFAANQTFIFSGTFGSVNTTFTNPYDGTAIILNGTYNVNNSTYTGQGGGNTLLMTNASDFITLDSADAGHTPNVQTIVDVQRIVTGDGDDFLDLASADFTLPAITIYGGSGTEIIWTNSGDTTVNTGTGNTTVRGGPGNDIINGGTGNDTIDSGAGTNIINSGGGGDSIYGHPGDLINGGTGTDTLLLTLTAAQRQADAADIAAAQAFIAANSDSSTSTGPQYTFTSPDLSGLTFSNIETLLVPEPSGLALLAFGAAGLWARRRSRPAV